MNNNSYIIKMIVARVIGLGIIVLIALLSSCKTAPAGMYYGYKESPNCKQMRLNYQTCGPVH